MASKASNKDFYNRMREMAGIKSVNESKNETKNTTLIDVERSNDGTAYGIVKENHNYFIKKSLKEGDVSVTDFIHINGIENRGKYQYQSLGEAEKQRNFYIMGINEAFDQGGVYHINENKEAPSLEVKEDFSSLVKRTISEGKKNINENREKSFKSTLPKKNEEKEVKKGLMPEAANIAVKKALGLLVEEAPFTDKPTDAGAEVTADSEIKDSEILADKKGKEKPQAPINDSNAKAKAEKATATGKKGANKYPNASNSIAVNQETEVLKEGEFPKVNADSEANIEKVHNPDKEFGAEKFRDTDSLSTADSEINTNDSPANSKAKKESPQAPINDSNAKKEAEKATASSNASSAISNNTDESQESDPFDDKENTGDEKGDIVTEDADKGQPFDDKAKLSSKGDIVAADSDESDADRVDDETKHENPDAEYNNYNQPEKGQKENKGEQTEQPESDPFDDKTKAGQEKGDIVAEEAAKALGSLLGEGDSKEKKQSEPFDKKTKAGDEKGDIVAEGDSKEKEESEPFDDKTKAGDEKGDIVAEGEVEDAMSDPKAKQQAVKDMKAGGEKVVEGKDLSTADSEINADESPVNDKENLKYNEGKLKKGTSKSMNDNAIAEGTMDEAGEEDIDAAAASIDDLEAAADAEMSSVDQPTDTEVGAELSKDLGSEIPDGDGGEEAEADVDIDVDAEVPADGGEEAVEGGSDDLIVKEIEKLVGKTTQKIRNADLQPETAEGFLKSIVASFEDKLPEMDLNDRKETADKILKADDKDIEADVDVDVDAEVPADGGEEVGDAEVGGGEFAAVEEPAMEEDAPMEVNGEEVIDDQIPDGDGGTFETYMESRGYTPDTIGECSVTEMGSLVSGYVSDKEDIGEDEIKNIAKYMNNDVATELEEYGHGDFAEKAKPFIEEDGVSFGSVEPTISPIEMIDDDEDMDDEFEPEEEVSDEIPTDSEVDVVVGDEPPVDDAPDVSFAPAAQALGGGVVKPEGAKTKSVEVDVNTGKVKFDVSEGNVRVKNYIQNKLQELAGKKKPTINESSKSDSLKKLDRIIEQQWKLFGENLLKN